MAKLADNLDGNVHDLGGGRNRAFCFEREEMKNAVSQLAGQERVRLPKPFAGGK
jgi:hypothetical protein